jgi:hypothetical protein
MAIFKKKVTAHDDGRQTVQKEFVDPKTNKVHPDSPDEPKKQKAKAKANALDENEIHRRKTIAKIYRDTKLTPKEKNDQIQSLLKESEKVRDQPTQGSKQVDADNDIGRRQQIGSIFKESGLTPKEKLERISALATETEKEKVQEVQEKEGTEDAETAQRRQIQDVYKDNKLDSKEKHQRIQAIMKGGDIVVEVDNDGGSSYRSGSDRSGSYSSRRSSDYSGSYSRSEYSDEYSSRGSRSGQEPRDSRSGQEPEQAMVRPSSLTQQEPEQAMDRAASLTQQTPKGTKEDDSDHDDEEKGNPRRRMICCTVFALLLVAAIAGPLYKYWDDITGKASDTTIALTEPPTEIPEPTAFPTELVLLYNPPTDAQCFAISRGNDIVGQGDLDITSFDIEIDVAVSNDNLEFESLVATLEERMQERIAPSLAGCPTDSRRLTGLRGIRILNDKRYVIRNAKVNAEPDTGRTCNVQEPCFSVLTRLTLFLAGPEDTSVLTNRIDDSFNQELTLENLGLSDPFRGLTFVGATASSPTSSPTNAPTTNAPTIAPSVMPSPNPSASSSPTVETSSAPSTSTTQATQPPNDDSSSIRSPIIESALETIGPLDDLNQHAVDWLIQDDTWLPDDTSDASVWIQRYVMYILFKKTCGHEWQEDDGWLGATSICDGWFGVSCDGDANEATGLQLGGFCRAQ